VFVLVWRAASCSIYRRGKAVSRPGSSTRSSCLPVNGGSGSSSGGISDGESMRRDGGAVGQDPTGTDAMESEPGQQQARGGGARWLASCGNAELRHDQSSWRWRARAALRVEGVAAQTARPRLGRHTWLGTARRARHVSEAPAFAHGLVHAIIVAALLLLHHVCACCCVACAASTLLHCNCFCLLTIAREQAAEQGVLLCLVLCSCPG
jgi:hypothetical protein